MPFPVLNQVRIDAAGSGSITLQQSDTGSFTQTGGTNTLASALLINPDSTLYLGYSAGSSGAYTLSGGGTLSVIQAEIVGNAGTGSFTQTGGYNIITDCYLVVGKNGGSGTYSLSGDGSLTVQTQEVIGQEGTGVFDQTGGTNSVIGNLILAADSGSSGTYNLEGGTLAAEAIQVNSGGALYVTGVGDKLVTTVTGDVTNIGTVKTTNADVT